MASKNGTIAARTFSSSPCSAWASLDQHAEQDEPEQKCARLQGPLEETQAKKRWEEEHVNSPFAFLKLMKQTHCWKCSAHKSQEEKCL